MKTWNLNIASNRGIFSLGNVYTNLFSLIWNCISFQCPFLCGRGLFPSNMPWRFKFFLLTVFSYHALYYETTPPTPAKKRDRTTTNEWGKSCNLQWASVLAGRRSWRSLKYPGHNNSRATQANLQLRCVTVINIRCLSSLLSPLKKHVWLGPNILGLFYKKKHARVQEILSWRMAQDYFFPRWCLSHRLK